MPTSLDPQSLVKLIQQNLQTLGIDYERLIKSFGQVSASELRAKGKQFSFDEHLKAMILAFLSNQRPWKPIADNLERLAEIFCHYDHTKIKSSDPHHFISAVLNISCGNRRISFQMKALRPNIHKLENIEARYGTLDDFVAGGHAHDIAKALSDPNSPHKMQELGFTLAAEYLRNVGIRAGKPDIHMRRILSSERLGFTTSLPSEKETFDKLAILAKQAEINEIYFDNLLWLFCAVDYGNICSATPRCHLCFLTTKCNYSR